MAGCAADPPPNDEGEGSEIDASAWNREPPPDVAPLAAPVEPAPTPAADVTLAVRSDQGLYTIASDVYGWNDWNPATPVGGGGVHPTSLRLGGNRLTAYNWENNASNAGSDYMNQNDGFMSPSTVPGAAIATVVDRARGMNASVVVTVPIGDYVAADRSPGGDVKTDMTNAYLMTRFRKNVAAKMDALSLAPDTTDDSVYQDEMINWVKTKYPNAPLAFALDNEPDLWSSTHSRIHPSPVGYDELVMRNIAFATMIKTIAPTSDVLGFVSYGWNGYQTLQNAPDRGAKGVFISYYLDQMKAAEATAGKRLVDRLDLHWYPEARGGNVRITGSDTTAAVVEAREQAPRSLWDPDYTESSWITQAKGGPIVLIPWLRGLIDQHYPGTKLSFSEWNYGGGTDISGAIATADVLGIMGREGVTSAHVWPSGQETFTMAALGAYVNYDGQGHGFGDVGLAATTSDKVAASVYASFDGADPTRVVIVAINKKTTMQSAAVTIAYPMTFTAADVWVLTSAAPAMTQATALTAAGTNAFLYPMPAQSVSVIVPR